MIEEWRDIPGFEGRYQVSGLGRVKSLPFLQRYLLRNGKEAYRRTRERIRKTKPQNSGYAVVDLWLDDIRYARTVHRLVAQAFVPNPEGLPEVNHLDGVKANCRASNLEWATSKGNHEHAVAIGLHPQAVRVVSPTTGALFPSISAAAKACGVSPKTVQKQWVRA